MRAPVLPDLGRSVPGVGETFLFRGAAWAGAPARHVVEIAHGATRGEHFDAVQARLACAIAAELRAFFFVNTDVGAPELGFALAHAICAAAPEAEVRVLRCLVPRTFVDCNRQLAAGAAAWKEGRVTPGMGPWVTDEGDRALLHGLHAAYQALAEHVIGEVCAAGGRALLLHTYAPRSVEVEVDAGIVASLRAAYTPERVGAWPMRPELDVIGRSVEGTRFVPEAEVARLRAALAPLGRAVADGETYPLHPSTCAWHHVARFPGQVTCLEVRRDLLVPAFIPFVELDVDDAAVERLAGGLREGWA